MILAAFALVSGYVKPRTVMRLTTLSLLMANSIQGATAAGNELWDFRFGRPGLSGAVTAAWFQGQWYVGGVFDSAGHFKAENITRWDGQEWRPVGEGLHTDEPYLSTPLPVMSLAVWNGSLYAGGSLARSGARELTGLARWDGTTWAAVSGLSGSVFQSVGTTDALFVAGSLQRPGDTNVYAIARWDGAAWDFLDSRVNAGPQLGARVLAVHGSTAFMSGGFETLAGQPISYNAWWDGAQWKPLPGLTNQEFFAMAVFRGDLFASGYFTQIGGVAATNIARWDGTNWWAVGSGLNRAPATLVSDGAFLYAAGNFAHTGAGPADGVARWDGLSWQSVGEGEWPEDNYPISLALGSQGSLAAVGSFSQVNGAAAGGVAVWHGEHWAPLVVTNTLGPIAGLAFVLRLAAGGPDLYAAGRLGGANSLHGDEVYQLGATSRIVLGGPFSGNSGRVYALAAHGTNVFAGGSFTNAGGQAVSKLAEWNGQTWQPVGGGLPDDVQALAADGTHLYVGGDFTRAGDVTANHVADWDGTSWSALGNGLGGSPSVLALSGARLYAGGAFTNAGALLVGHLAVWNGVAWQGVGGGLDGDRVSVNAMALSGTNLYVGGRFTSAGGVVATNIAGWDGTQWRSLGTGASNGIGTIVTALAVHGGYVYAGGGFTHLGGIPALSLARWDGTNWSALGSGLGMQAGTARVYSLLGRDDGLWVGGLFSTSGNKAASSLAHWVEKPQLWFSTPEPLAAGTRITVEGALGLRFTLQTSPNLHDWFPWTDGQGSEDRLEFLDPAKPAPQFYRAVLTP